MSVGVHCGGVELEHLGIPGPVPGRKTKVPVLSDVNCSLVMDDCESTAELATMIKMALMDSPDTPEGLRRAIGDWPMFREFTGACYAKLSAIVNRGVEMLRSGALKITTAVGLATSAAASDEKSQAAAEFSGHCFNISCVTTGKKRERGFDFDNFVIPIGDAEEPAEPPRLHFAIMEGTAATSALRVTPSSPQILATLFSRESGEQVTKVMSFNQYASGLAQAVNELTRVINAPNGGRQAGGGWPLRAPPVTGWTSSELLMNSLDSSRDSYLEFYNRIIFMGWKCNPAASGCMPVEVQHRAQAASSSTQQQPTILSGCHPYDLNNQLLQAIDAFVPSEHKDTMDAIMNEAHPPIVDEAVLRRISEYWAPCSPFADLNSERQGLLTPGVEYVRVACMESPGIPELVPAICMAKHAAFELADKINRERPDSDGVRFVSGNRGAPRPEGTGFHGFLEIPVRSSIPTALSSLRRALVLLHWPGYVPTGHE
jgi:hypothetical protein